jgi:hypothetical protein
VALRDTGIPPTKLQRQQRQAVEGICFLPDVIPTAGCFLYISWTEITIPCGGQRWLTLGTDSNSLLASVVLQLIEQKERELHE